MQKSSKIYDAKVVLDCASVLLFYIKKGIVFKRDDELRQLQSEGIFNPFLINISKIIMDKKYFHLVDPLVVPKLVA
jgi:hypothetical protein